MGDKDVIFRKPLRSRGQIPGDQPPARSTTPRKAAIAPARTPGYKGPVEPSTKLPRRVPDAFIPFQRQDLVDLCLQDGGVDNARAQGFRDFASLLAAYTHFEFHQQLEEIKGNYWPFDPDCLTIANRQLTSAEKRTASATVADGFRQLAQLANFRELTRQEIEASFRDSTLFKLNTEVNLDDFERVICFVRGDASKTEKVPGLAGMKDIECRVWERVLLFLHFKPEEHFATKESRKKKTKPALSFCPGRIYVYFYKDVPQLDLELLFPNVKLSMTPRDKLLLSVPAVGAGAATVVKVLAKITLVLTALALTFSWGWLLERMPGDRPVTVDQLAALSAFFTVVLTLAMFAFKQWDNFKNKRTSFLKQVTENLFFRNLASNQSVFHRMLDSAEEEECKEALLVYYHLLSHSGPPLTATELDARIETWMRDRFGTVIDFDIAGPIQNLQRIRGQDRQGRERSLLSVNSAGHLDILPLEDALHVLDHLWDRAYQF